MSINRPGVAVIICTPLSYNPAISIYFFHCFVKRPRKEWSEVIEEDLRRMGLRADDARDRDNWRKYIRGARMT